MKIKKLSYSIMCLLVGIYGTSCTYTSNSLPGAQGSAGDVLIVMKENFWKGACGDSIRNFLREPVMGLPAPEPMFSLSYQNEMSRLAQKFRSILIVNIDMGYEYAKLGYKTDVYSRNQSIFNIDAPSADSAIACMYRNKDAIIARILMKDRDAIIEDYARATDRQVIEKLREKFHVDILIPKSYYMDVERTVSSQKSIRN